MCGKNFIGAVVTFVAIALTLLFIAAWMVRVESKLKFLEKSYVSRNIRSK